MTVTTPRGRFTRMAEEALGSRLVPLSDAGLNEKFLGLVAPVLGETRAQELLQRLWRIDAIPDVTPLLEVTALA